MNKRLLLFLVFITSLIYIPSLLNGFVNWDDDVHLLHNAFIYPLSFHQIVNMFTTTVNKIYIPLTTLSFAVEYAVFGDWPFIYHFNNTLLHIITTLLVFRLIVLLGLNVRAAFFAALVFGLHPMHVESVAWVTERKDVLYAALYLWGVCRYISYVKSDKKTWLHFLPVICLGALSLLSKPMALSFPLILFSVDLLLKRRLDVRALLEKAYCGIVFAPIVFLTYIHQSRIIEIDLIQSALIWVWCFSFYIFKFFWPFQFTLFYRLPQPVNISNVEYIFPAVFFLSLTVGFLILRRAYLFRFAVSWYILSIFFLLRMDTAADANIVADRFMYLPSLGICMWIGFHLDHLCIRQVHSKIRLVLYFIIGLLYSFLGYQSVQQTHVWQNGVSLWSHQLKVRPLAATAIVYNKLAQAMLSENKGEVTLELQHHMKDLYQRALTIKPDYEEAYLGLASLNERVGELDSARRQYEKILEINASSWAAYVGLAKIAYRTSNYGEMDNYFIKALAKSPDNILLIRDIIKFYSDHQEIHIPRNMIDNLKTAL